MEKLILFILILKLVIFIGCFITLYYMTEPRKKRLFDRKKLKRNDERLGNRQDAAITGIHSVIPMKHRQCAN